MTSVTEMQYATNMLVPNVTYEEYDKVPGLRSGYLKLMMRSPAHFQAAQRKPKEITDALAFGNMFHKAMENPEKFMDTMIVEPIFSGKTRDGRDSTRSTAAKEAREDWYKNLKPDSIVVKEAWHDNLVGMLQSALKHKLVGNFLKHGVRETSLWVEDDETGILLKCRPDFISAKGHMVDIKTTRDASHRFFMRQIFSEYSDTYYALQAAHYSHCARLSKVCKGEAFIFIAIEKEDPWGIKIYPLDHAGIDVGEPHRKEMTRRYVECVKNNHWPCYEEKAEPVMIPSYVKWVDYGE